MGLNYWNKLASTILYLLIFEFFATVHRYDLEEQQLLITPVLKNIHMAQYCNHAKLIEISAVFLIFNKGLRIYLTMLILG